MNKRQEQTPIGIIDYGMGNLGSVAKALAWLGCPAEIVSRPEQAARFDRLVLPGVGAMSFAMESLVRSGLDQAVLAHLRAGRPFLGICLGMHLLFERSEEGDATGLGYFPGVVRRFEPQPGFKVPHMGWNQIEESRLPLIPTGGSFYFVHSYHVCPADERLVAARCDYGGLFVAAVQQGPVLLTQFHPEKSGDTGIRLLRAWSENPSF